MRSPSSVISITPPPKHDHPAVYSEELWPTLIEEMRGHAHVLDPFSGTGLIHELAKAAGVRYSTGIELEPDWANHDLYPVPPREQIIGDFFRVSDPPTNRIDVICVSPTYANRMADHHNAQERCKNCSGSGWIVMPSYVGNPPERESCPKCDGTGHREYKRNTYRHRLDRPLTKGNSGQMQWGGDYQDFHRRAWEKCYDLLVQRTKQTPKFILNIKDHIRKEVHIHVSNWHRVTLQEIGFTLVRWHKVETPSNRYGANRDRRVDFESVIVMEKR